MSRAARRSKSRKPAISAPPTPQSQSPLLTRKRVSLALMAVALLYAFLGGFHTVFDFDIGWHLATGRYVLQHHAIPSTDVLSYTSAGAPLDLSALCRRPALRHFLHPWIPRPHLVLCAGPVGDGGLRPAAAIVA